jgi:hypothetical protein
MKLFITKGALQTLQNHMLNQVKPEICKFLLFLMYIIYENCAFPVSKLFKMSSHWLKTKIIKSPYYQTS